MTWSEEENNIILKHFGNLEKAPSKKDVIEAFDTIHELKPLLEAKGISRCLDKVKNTFKKLAKSK